MTNPVYGIKRFFGSWDDEKFPALALKALAGAEPDYDPDTGAFLFSHIRTEAVICIYQLTHKWVLDSDIGMHLHWRKTTDAAGTPAWKIRYKGPFGLGDLEPDFGAWAGPDGHTQAIESDQICNLSYWPRIDMDGADISNFLIFQIEMDHTESTYPADTKLFEFDLHVLQDHGSFEEFTKTPDK